jgi:predicted RecA/RadA family phage recombinase
MANDFIKPGEILTFTAPGGGVVSGALVRIGQLLVVAMNTVAATLPFEGKCIGVFLLPKIAGVAWTEGMLLYHDSVANNIGTVVSATTMRVGVAAAAALSGDTTGLVKLTGAPAPLNVI